MLVSLQPSLLWFLFLPQVACIRLVNDCTPVVHKAHPRVWAGPWVPVRAAQGPLGAICPQKVAHQRAGAGMHAVRLTSLFDVHTGCLHRWGREVSFSEPTWPVQTLPTL